MRACGGVWIAHGGGSADRETVDRHDRLPVPPDDPAYTLRRVWLSDEEQDGYYYGARQRGPVAALPYRLRAARPSASRTGAIYKAVNRRFADVVVRGGDLRKSDRAGAGLSFRAAAAHDPQPPAQGDHRDFLAHSLAQRGNLRDLPLARGNPRRPARLVDPRLPHPLPLQQFPRRRRPLHREPDRPREFVDLLRGARDFGAALSDFDRMAAARARRPAAGRPNAAPMSAPASAWPRTSRIAVGVERFDYTKGILDRMRAVDDLLTAVAAVARQVRADPGRGADAQQARRLRRPAARGGNAGGRDQRADMRGTAGSRSVWSSATTSRTRCSNFSAPPTSASCRACTTE